MNTEIFYSSRIESTHKIDEAINYFTFEILYNKYSTKTPTGKKLLFYWLA